jgi:hypothetical protein
LRIVFAAVEVQKDDVGLLRVEFANRCLRTEDLANAVARVFQNFVEDVTKSFVRIYQQDALNSGCDYWTCQELPLPAPAKNSTAHCDKSAEEAVQQLFKKHNLFTLCVRK